MKMFAAAYHYKITYHLIYCCLVVLAYNLLQTAGCCWVCGTAGKTFGLGLHLCFSICFAVATGHIFTVLKKVAFENASPFPRSSFSVVF